MMARFAEDGDRLQIVVECQTNEERILMGQFVRQLLDLGIHLHGHGTVGGLPGTSNLNFGSPPRCLLPEAKVRRL